MIRIELSEWATDFLEIKRLTDCRRGNDLLG